MAAVATRKHDDCAREESLHGGKVTQPTDTRGARGCLSARSLAYVRHRARARKGGRQGFQPGLDLRGPFINAGKHRWGLGGPAETESKHISLLPEYACRVT